MRLANLTFLALLAASLALVGCGGGDGAQSATTASSTAAGGEMTTLGRQESANGAGGQGRGSERPAGKPEAPEEVPASAPKRSEGKVVVPPTSSAAVPGTEGASPGVKTVKGGDNSVQRYGIESDRSRLLEAAGTVQAYLNARLARDWEGACSYLTEKVRSGLERFAAKARGESVGPSGCAEGMKALSEKATQAVLRQSATIEKVLSLRTGGEIGADQGFLLYVGPPESTLYSVPMNLEGGEWKVGAMVPAEPPV